MKKFVSMITLAGLLLLSFGNCFGKFGFTRSVYGVHANINIGSGKWAGFFRSLLLIFPFSIAYYVTVLLDVLLFNLIEFWTGYNPMGMGEGTEQHLTTIQGENGSYATLNLSRDGKEMDVTLYAEGKTTHFVVQKDKPGRLFQRVGGVLVDKTDLAGPTPAFF